MGILSAVAVVAVETVVGEGGDGEERRSVVVVVGNAVAERVDVRERPRGTPWGLQPAQKPQRRRQRRRGS